jgi:hypothetical protein
MRGQNRNSAIVKKTLSVKRRILIEQRRADKVQIAKNPLHSMTPVTIHTQRAA